MKYWKKMTGVYCPNCGWRQFYHLDITKVDDYEATYYCMNCDWSGIIVDCPVIDSFTDDNPNIDETSKKTDIIGDLKNGYIFRCF